MMTSRSDWQTHEEGKYLSLWVAIMGIVVATYMAVAI